VLEDRIDISSVHQMNFTPDEYELFQLQYGDILLNEGQSAELVGRPAMFRDELPGACFQNHLIRFRSRPEVDPDYALLVFLHYLHSGRFLALARGSTNIANLGLQRFRAMPFPLPPLSEQHSIVKEARRRMGNVRDQSDATRSSLARLPDMVAELLAAAVAGELVPQATGDEPADQLLDRFGLPPKDAPSPTKVRREEDEDAMSTHPPLPSYSRTPSPDFTAILQTAAGPISLPELFAKAGYDRDQPEDIEQFYLALRGAIGRSIRSAGLEQENATLEALVSAS
jgi:type I restriction enzyme S subunit